MTSATEVLRRLLDERGVEYEGETDEDGWAYTRWHGFDDTGWLAASDELCGLLDLRGRYLFTPEQAIAATLGSFNCTDDERTNGTCRNVADDGFECSECKSWWTGPRDTKPPMLWGFKYCPNCGRRIEQ